MLAYAGFDVEIRIFWIATSPCWLRSACTIAVRCEGVGVTAAAAPPTARADDNQSEGACLPLTHVSYSVSSGRSVRDHSCQEPE